MRDLLIEEGVRRVEDAVVGSSSLKVITAKELVSNEKGRDRSNHKVW